MAFSLDVQLMAQVNRPAYKDLQCVYAFTFCILFMTVLIQSDLQEKCFNKLKASHP